MDLRALALHMQQLRGAVLDAQGFLQDGRYNAVSVRLLGAESLIEFLLQDIKDAVAKEGN